MVWKRSAPGQTSGGPEVSFYKIVHPRTACFLMVPCYSAEYCTETKVFSLLLEELEANWVPASHDPLVPPEPCAREMLLDALLQFHLTWWEASELKSTTFRYDKCTEAVFRQIAQRRNEALQLRALLLESQLSSEIIERYSELLQALPYAMSQRLRSGEFLTLIHGDAHAGNFLVRPDGKEGAKIIDWPNWRPGVVTDDLTYLIAAWPEDAQNDALQRLLPGYFQKLCSELERRGMAAYPRDLWYSDLELSAGWTFLYTVGLLAEAPAEWAVPVINRAAALERKCRRVCADLAHGTS